MKRLNKDILGPIAAITICLMVVTVCVLAMVMATRDIQKSKQSKVYQIDTTKVQILYEDTWGKIFIVKEEDL